MSGNELTRRSFVKMGMAGLAGGALTAMGGCAAQPQTQSQSQTEGATFPQTRWAPTSRLRKASPGLSPTT